MKRLRAVAFGSALAALAGCAAGPDYVRPEVEIPAAFKEAGNWKVAEPSDHLPRGKWWEVFGNAQLNELLEQVEISNQNVHVAEAQYRQALALVDSAYAALFPSLTGNVSVTRSRSPAGLVGGTTAGRTIVNRSATIEASWETDLWARLGRAVEANAAGAQASAANLAGARLSAQATLAQNYFQLRVLDAQKQLLDETIAAYRKSLELTKNRYAVGVAARADVVQAETQLESTRAQAIDLDVQRSQFEHAVALLVGKPPASFSIAPAPLAARLPKVPPGLPSALLERRPDIAAAERQVAAANAQIGVNQAAFFPSLTLSASTGSRSADAAQWFAAPSRLWSFGPALAQAIFDAGRRRALTNQAIAAHDASVAAYRQTVLVGFQEVEDNLAALRILEEESQVQDVAVRLARDSVVLTTNQYKAGTVSYLNVVTAQATQLANERAAAAILGRRLSAAVLLIKALGGGWEALELPHPDRR